MEVGWTHPSSGSNPIFTFPGSSAQMGGPSTSYIMSIYPYSAMIVPTYTFPMAILPLTSGASSGVSQFYSMEDPLHEVPSSQGNVYPHLSNPFHVDFSSQADSSVMIPLQPFMNQFGGGYHPVGQGHGVYQNPFWPTISQNQSFPKPWSQILQLVADSHARSKSPVTASHTAHTSPNSASHVGDS